MFERFTDRARKVMALSNQEAQRFNHEYVGTEHILLGLVKEGSGVAAIVMKNMGIDLRRARLEVEKLVKNGPDCITMGKLPQTPRAKKVIEYSIEEARGLGHNYVGTEHLLLGLVREEDGIAAQVLKSLGATAETIREEVLSLVGTKDDESEPVPTVPTVPPATEPKAKAEWTSVSYTCTISANPPTLDETLSQAEHAVRQLIGRLTLVATTAELVDLSNLLVKISEMGNKYKKGSKTA